MQMVGINLDVECVVASNTALGGRFNRQNFGGEERFVDVHEHKAVVRAYMFIERIVTARLDEW